MPADPALDLASPSQVAQPSLEHPVGTRWYERRLLGARVAVWIFLCFALLLFTGTHWPQLRIEGPIPRTDLWMHFGAFATWTFLCGCCAFFGPRWSRANIGTTCLIGLLYAALDEGLQLIPQLGRTAAFDDYGANAIGVAIGCLALYAIRVWRIKRGATPRAEPADAFRPPQ
jgi:VanZ family protein